jgi:5-dehydro-2-deoxygluconokinase
LPSRETTLAALRAHRGTTIFDLDWRPTLWDEPDEYPALAAEAVAAADIVIGNEEEVEASRVTDVPTLVLKRGERGVTVYDRGEETDVPGFPVEVVNGLGAGDAFAAALGHSLLHDLPLAEAARRGNVAGALVASRLACSEAMPRLVEIEAALV